MNLCVRSSTKVSIISENKRLQLAAQQTLSQKNLKLRIKSYCVFSDLRVPGTIKELDNHELVIILASNDNVVEAYLNHVDFIEAPVFVMGEDLFRISVDALDIPDSAIQPALRKSYFPYRIVSLSGILGIIMFAIDGGRACAQSHV